jgi:acyl-CoA reductase-like NAD-dependent aldehyde dehydrogenase
MSLPLYTSFIDGKTVECAQSFFDLVTPHDGQIVGRIAEAGRDGVDIAVKAASLAFARHRKQPAHVRIGWLRAAAKALLEAADDVAVTFARTSASRSGWHRSRFAGAQNFSKPPRPH